MMRCSGFMKPIWMRHRILQAWMMRCLPCLRKPPGDFLLLWNDWVAWLRAPRAVKGQITGPFTLGTAIKDPSGIAIFHDDVLRDMVVKLLCMKARWQVEHLASKGFPVIFFIDEPALAGYGTSEFISVSREVIVDCLSELVGAIQDAAVWLGFMSVPIQTGPC